MGSYLFANATMVTSIEKEYEEKGICAFDPKHIHLEKFIEHPRGRVCKHCGLVQELKTTIVTQEVSKWVTVEKPAS